MVHLRRNIHVLITYHAYIYVKYVVQKNSAVSSQIFLYRNKLRSYSGSIGELFTTKDLNSKNLY